MINFVSIGNRRSWELVSLPWRGCEIIHDAPLGTWRALIGAAPPTANHKHTEGERANERTSKSLFALMPNRFGADVWSCNELISRHRSSTEGARCNKSPFLIYGQNLINSCVAGVPPPQLKYGFIPTTRWRVCMCFVLVSASRLVNLYPVAVFPSRTKGWERAQVKFASESTSADIFATCKILLPTASINLCFHALNIAAIIKFQVFVPFCELKLICKHKIMFTGTFTLKLLLLILHLNNCIAVQGVLQQSS